MSYCSSFSKNLFFEVLRAYLVAKGVEFAFHNYVNPLEDVGSYDYYLLDNADLYLTQGLVAKVIESGVTVIIVMQYYYELPFGNEIKLY